MTIKQLLIREHLLPALDIEILVAETIHRDRAWLYAHPEYRLTWWERLRFEHNVRLYRHGFSIATIAGHKEFFKLDFLVNRHTLVPRPDTELLVETVLQNITNAPTLIIDVGTGSGCIPVAIAKNATTPLTIFATDISAAALRVAKKNTVRHQATIQFFYGDLLLPLIRKLPSLLSTYQLIVTANLPYLSVEQFKNEPSIQREPYNALVATEKGLGLYRKLLEQLQTILAQTKNHSTIQLFLEIDPSQTNSIQTIITTIFPAAKTEIKKDLATRDRLVVVTIS